MAGTVLLAAMLLALAVVAAGVFRKLAVAPQRGAGAGGNGPCRAGAPLAVRGARRRARDRSRPGVLRVAARAVPALRDGDVLTCGAVAVSRRVQGGASEPLARLGEGDFFGEAALLGDPVRNATVTADDAVTVLRLRRAEVLALDDDHPEIGARLREADQQRRAAPG